MVKEALFSHGTDDWGTPRDRFAKWNKVYRFGCDAAASKDNALCDNFYGPGSPISENALDIEWRPDWLHWCNPPYSMCKEFLDKVYNEYKRGVNSVVLIPARTDTKYWHKYVEGIAEVTRLKGRLKFEGAANSAPFPSVLLKYINY